jgi:putative FmdB family regulatory protein
MVHYGFYCPDCKKAFSNVFEHRKDAEVSITCPHCGSRKVQQHLSSASEEDDRARVLSNWEGEGGAPGAEKVA